MTLLFVAILLAVPKAFTLKWYHRNTMPVMAVVFIKKKLGNANFHGHGLSCTSLLP